MHIFISYEHNDLDFAENVISRLEKEGFTTWADNKLNAGEEWRTMIDLAIKNAFALVVIMTPTAKASEYVTYEWAFAWGVGVKVIPIMLNLTPLHPRLEALQYLDFTNPKARPWVRLVEEVKSATSSPLAQTIRIPLNASPFIRQAVIALDSASPDARDGAIKTLVQLRSSDVQGVLLEALQHPIVDVRQGAAWGLGEIGDASAIPALCEALRDTASDVREAAAAALGEIGDASAVPALCETLRDGDGKVQIAVISALAQIGGASVVPALCEALKGPWYVQQPAAAALGKIGDASAVPALCKALKGASFISTEYEELVASALVKIGDASAIPVLREALHNNSSRGADLLNYSRGADFLIAIVLKKLEENISQASHNKEEL
jgi:HEAT repeat protein